MSAPVNVLAVMDSVIAGEREWGAYEAANALTNARAAVAELIEAASGIEGLARLRAAPLRDYRAAVDRLTAALARVGGAA
ncbi:MULTISPECIES: hypothetical protein [Xanthomonas]|uniref:hypothetical protein n=1 Tax=Xanthomonas TaxID=338 RepID=UPI001ADB2672|nr:hypothetical protein [Xanthomonas phaseoli]MBO9766481.1 hypothetical protein [Xanthomonas phaseoli pv. dieffenbachiae]MBO9776174.1 hypothetical protein [Xanthomonas phaseoli pv. dieffenbachiae]MBO9778227.1 hypothetical protein [Xanthomonas phaseoli pv. dieffenbachiae]MBO9795384.1 hypothetical protein [Xanthomonas phaseoli pv. dieffenbachiae]MBO9801421.1 hypothetical protein [Xanthomonas phaseoli pv. dieffenbachiae]